MSELLSISIPTRNRGFYLRELLNSIFPQLDADPQVRRIVRVYVFDNASTDDTGRIVKEFEGITYRRNSQDIGGDPNILQAYTAVSGEYVWVIGDDELVPEDRLGFILDKVRTYNPHLFLNNSHGYKPFVRLPLLCSSYADFAHYLEKRNPHMLIAHSLISANIVLRRCFDAKFAVEKIDTHYGHMFGIVKGLQKYPGSVYLPSEKTLIVRKERATPVDGKWPEALGEDQANYLEWLAVEYGLDINARSVVSDYNQRIFLANTPITLRLRSFVMKALRSMYDHTYATIPATRPLWRIARFIYRRLKQPHLLAR